MARLFASASSERILTSLGAGGSLNGAMTLAGIIKNGTASGNTTGTVISIGSGASAATVRQLVVVSATGVLRVRSNNVTRDSTTALSFSGPWYFVAVTKASGTATPRFHIYDYSTGTWTHENTAGGTLGDSTPVTGSSVGDNRNTAFYNGHIAAAAAWPAALTDAQVEALAYSLMAWWAVQPNTMWVLDQTPVGQKMLDLTGNGANESGITGTAVGTASVPILTYGHEPIYARPGGAPQTVNLVAATAAWSARPLVPSTGAATVNLAAATAAWSASALAPTGAAQTVNVVAATAAWSAQALSPLGAAATVNLVAATASWSAGQIAPLGAAVTRDLVAAVATWSASQLAPAGAAATVNLVAASASWSASGFTVDNGEPQTVDLVAAVATWSARPLSPAGVAVTVNLVAAVAAWSARPLVPLGAAIVANLVAAVASWSAQPLAPSVPIVGTVETVIFTEEPKRGLASGTVRRGGLSSGHHREADLSSIDHRGVQP